MEEVKSKKSELRKRLISQRNSISQDEVKIAEIQFAINFLKNKKLMELVKNSKSPIAIYFPSKNELSPLALAKHLSKKYNIKFCLPTIKKKHEELKFISWSLQEDELQPSQIYKNILEPISNKILKSKEKSQYITPEILIIPLVGFDKNCNRLGMGGGFYDRTITNLRKQIPKIITIGISYEMQKLHEIPIEKNDKILDFVVTEDVIYQRN